MQLRRGQWGIKGQVKHQHLGAADRAQQRREVLHADALARELAAEEPRGEELDYCELRSRCLDDFFCFVSSCSHDAVTFLLVEQTRSK